MEKSKIYTCTGDLGATSLVGGQRVKKTDIRIEAYGSVDELNANIGVLMAIPNLQPQIVEVMKMIQNKLFNIGAYLATPNPDNAITQCPGLSASDVHSMEEMIDFLDSQLPQNNKLRTTWRNPPLGSSTRLPHNVPPLRTPDSGPCRHHLC